MSISAKFETTFEKAAKLVLQRANILQSLSLTFATAGVVASLSTLIFADRFPDAEKEPGTQTVTAIIETQRREISNLKEQVRTLQAQRPKAEKDGSSSEPSILEVRLTALEGRQARLEEVVMNSPEKALAIPMIRRDIDDLRAGDAGMRDQLRREIDRVFDLNKWVIGGLAAGVLSLVASQIFRRRPD